MILYVWNIILYNYFWYFYFLLYILTSLTFTFLFHFWNLHSTFLHLIFLHFTTLYSYNFTFLHVFLHVWWQSYTIYLIYLIYLNKWCYIVKCLQKNRKMFMLENEHYVYSHLIETKVWLRQARNTILILKINPGLIFLFGRDMSCPADMCIWFPKYWWIIWIFDD